MFNKPLDVEYWRYFILKMVMPLGLIVDDIWSQHLDVSITAEAAFILQFRNMFDRRMASIGIRRIRVLLNEIFEDRHDTWNVVAYFFHRLDSSAGGELRCGSWHSIRQQEVVKPCWHLLFVGMGPEFSRLEIWASEYIINLGLVNTYPKTALARLWF